jgi:CysZ protein
MGTTALEREARVMGGLGGGARGFIDGVGSIFRGVVFIARTPRAWLPALVPAIALIVLSALGIYFAIAFLTPAIVERIPTSSSGLGRALDGVLRVATAVGTGATAVLLAFWCTPLVSGPALERIVVLRERELGLPERRKVSFLRELYSGFVAGLFTVAVGAPTMAALWLVTLAFPPAAVVTLPLKFATALLLLVFGLIDYPLSLRGMRLGERLSFLRREAPALLGFGMGSVLLFAIPFGAIVLLPAAVAAATEISVRGECRARASQVNSGGTAP